MKTKTKHLAREIAAFTTLIQNNREETSDDNQEVKQNLSDADLELLTKFGMYLQLQDKKCLKNFDEIECSGFGRFGHHGRHGMFGKRHGHFGRHGPHHHNFGKHGNRHGGRHGHRNNHGHGHFGMHRHFGKRGHMMHMHDVCQDTCKHMKSDASNQANKHTDSAECNTSSVPEASLDDLRKFWLYIKGDGRRRTHCHRRTQRFNINELSKPVNISTQTEDDKELTEDNGEIEQII